MVALTDGFTGQNRISRDKFAAALTGAARDVNTERPLTEYYSAVRQYTNADPLMVLAIFEHESSMGLNGIATFTHSWGNMRNPPVGNVPYHVYHDQVKGDYLSFGSWLDGCLATAYHLDSPLYRGLSIDDAIHKWAPYGDHGNDPETYARNVVAFMNQWADQGGVQPMATEPTQADIGYPVQTIMAADTGPARGLDSINWFVVHRTQGHRGGDIPILTSANPPIESAHAYIDYDGALTFMVPLDVTAWHPGNDAVAVASIGVEQEGFVDEPYTDAQYASMAAFIRWCMARCPNLPAVYVGRQDAGGGWLPDASGIIGHQDVPDGAGGWGGVSHHTDPGPLYDFGRLVSLVTQGGTITPPAQTSWEQPGNPNPSVPLKEPFWNRYNLLEQTRAGLGLAMMGWALAPEIVWQGRRVQRFERGWFGAQETAGDPWDVVALFPEEWPR